MSPWERRAPARPIRQNENLSPPSPDPDATPKHEWYGRGYLPHRDRPGLLQMIPYRPADSLPKEVLARIDAEIKAELGLGVPRGYGCKQYWDRFIRDENHSRPVVETIHQNSVKAELAMPAARWPWSSAKAILRVFSRPQV